MLGPLLIGLLSQAFGVTVGFVVCGVLGLLVLMMITRHPLARVRPHQRACLRTGAERWREQMPRACFAVVSCGRSSPWSSPGRCSPSGGDLSTPSSRSPISLMRRFCCCSNSRQRFSIGRWNGRRPTGRTGWARHSSMASRSVSVRRSSRSWSGCRRPSGWPGFPHPPRLAAALVGLFLLPRVLPPVVTYLPASLLAWRFGLSDTKLALVLFDTALALPLVILVLHSAAREIPGEILEAARLDGTGSLGLLWRFILPLPAGGPGRGFLCFALSWNEFLFAFTNHGNGPSCWRWWRSWRIAMASPSST